MFRAAATLGLVLIAGDARPSGPERQAAAAACDRADAAYKQQQDSPAFDAAAECERLAQPLGAHDLLARAFAVRGNVLYRRDGALLDSIALYKAGLGAAERSGDQGLLSKAHCRLVGPYSSLGDFPAMMDAVRLCFETNPKPDDRARMRFLSDRGWAYMEIHEREAALRDLHAALELARHAAAELVGEFAMNLGLAYARLDDDRDKAIAYFDEALVIARRTNDTALLISLLNNSANQYRRPGGWGEAERRYAEALALESRDKRSKAFVLKNMGIVYRETGRPKLAEKILLEALALADRQGMGRIQWQARKELGTLYRTSEPARAARYYEECLDALEARNSNVLLEGFSAGALAGALTIQDDPYDLYIDLLLREGQPEKALSVAERARARAFLDTLTRARQAMAGGLSPGYVRSERELLKEISDNQSLLRAGDLAAGRQAEVTAAVRRAEERLEALHVRLATEHPEIAHARYPHLLTAAELQAQLVGTEDVLLEYFLGAEASTLWIVRKDGLSVARLVRKSELETAVRQYIEALGTPAGAYEKAGQTLAGLVLPKSLEGLAGARRLVIIPHGALHYLPFETLPDENGRFLIESFAVSYAPSAASLAYLRSRPPSPEGEVVAIGNPKMSGVGAGTERGAAIERVGLLKPLPYTGREIRAVAASYSGVTRVLEQDQATEPALSEAGLERAAILHFATHGLIDEESPERSGLALTMSPGSDGILQMREIYRLRLRAALVTLSACQTALGKEITGEGIVGLSRAFFYAGARAVMASLWNVNDASTAQFMERFYAALRRGEPADAAARTAKLAFMGDARLRHPYFWGAFIVTGDAGVPVRVVSPPHRLGPLVAVVLLAAIPGILLLFRRLFHRSAVAVR